MVNAISVYETIGNIRHESEKDFIAAHKLLMKTLVQDAGKYSKQGVGIMKDTTPGHIAPPFENVPFLMKDLFIYLKDNLNQP